MEIRKLNTLRGLAASIVAITHFSDITGWLDTSLGGRAGQYGVMLFFLLSGFLMSYLYFERHCTKPNVKSYFIARVARVFPLYFIVVLSSWLLYQAGFDGLYEIDSNQKLLSHLVFIFGESVLWTIAPEIHFYLIFVVFWLLASRFRETIYLLVVAILIALFFSNYPRPTGDFAGMPYDFHVFRSLPYFLMGMLMGMCYRRVIVPAYLRRHIFVFTLLLIPLMYPDFSPVSGDARMRMWLNMEVLLVMASVFFCVVFLVPDNNIVLANPIGDFLGKISYSLYLLHMPIILSLKEFNLSTELKLVVFLVLSLSVAWLSYRFLERPASGVIRKLAT